MVTISAFFEYFIGHLRPCLGKVKESKIDFFSEASTIGDLVRDDYINIKLFNKDR